MLTRTSRCLLVLLAAGCCASGGYAQSDVVSVFRQAIDARNRGDLDGMMQFFSPDAVREDGSCQPPCVGPPSSGGRFERISRII